MTGTLIRRWKFGAQKHTDTQREGHVETAAEIGVMMPQAST